MKRKILSNSIKYLMIELFKTQEPHQIIIKNNNDWEFPLPEKVMENYKDNLVLIMTKEIMQEAIIDDDYVKIWTSFNGEENSKEIKFSEIIAVTNNGSPYIINDEASDDVKIEKPNFEYFEDILTINGTQPTQARKSLEIFFPSNIGEDNE